MPIFETSEARDVVLQGRSDGWSVAIPGEGEA